MHFTHQIARLIAENTPAPAPANGGGHETFLDSVGNLLKSAGEFLAGLAAFGGAFLTYLASRQLRKTAQPANGGSQNTSAEQTPSNPGGGAV